MSRVLPILFNTEMVRAILDGRKTATRRVVKGNVLGILNSPYHKEHPEVPDKVLIGKLCNPPYQKGDTMYVRETWSQTTPLFGELSEYVYRTDYGTTEDDRFPPTMFKWHPSIHMPKEAARIWLEVTSVRVERLQDMNGQDILVNCHVHPEADYFDGNQKMMFAELWDSTIRKPDLKRYGWNANPWVWVIEFERCEKPGRKE